MSLSPLVSFKSRFVTYLLNFPRIYQQIENILEFWQHISAVKSHHQAKIEQCLGTTKACTLWCPLSFTIVVPIPVFVTQIVF